MTEQLVFKGISLVLGQPVAVFAPPGETAKLIVKGLCGLEVELESLRCRKKQSAPLYGVFQEAHSRLIEVLTALQNGNSFAFLPVFRPPTEKKRPRPS